MLHLEDDVENPNRHRVLNDRNRFIGFIHRIGPDEWQNTHVAEGKPLSPVPPGPFKTRELALDAFRKALPSR